jgi:hypothetical protein
VQTGQPRGSRDGRNYRPFLRRLETGHRDRTGWPRGSGTKDPLGGQFSDFAGITPSLQAQM